MGMELTMLIMYVNISFAKKHSSSGQLQKYKKLHIHQAITRWSWRLQISTKFVKGHEEFNSQVHLALVDPRLPRSLILLCGTLGYIVNRLQIFSLSHL